MAAERDLVAEGHRSVERRRVQAACPHLWDADPSEPRDPSQVLMCGKYCGAMVRFAQCKEVKGRTPINKPLIDREAKTAASIGARLKAKAETKADSLIDTTAQLVVTMIELKFTRKVEAATSITRAKAPTLYLKWEEMGIEDETEWNAISAKVVLGLGGSIKAEKYYRDSYGPLESGSDVSCVGIDFSIVS